MATDHSARKYSLGHYDPAWKSWFTEEAQKIKSVFQNRALAIEHIGSTAIPGMAAKPTIDILIFVNNILEADSEAIVEDLTELGYESLGSVVSSDSRLFAKEKDAHRIANIHVFEPSNVQAQEMIIVRDYLRAHPEELKNYSELKQQLFSDHPEDYAAYRSKKTSFINELTVRARRWHEKQR